MAIYLNNTYDLVQVYGSTYENIGQFLVSITEDYNINLKNIFKEVSEEFDIKGGGSPTIIQGKCAIEDLDKLLDLFLEKIKIAL